MQAYYPNGSPYRNLRHAFATIYQDGARAAVAAGCAGVWEVGQGAGEVVVVGGVPAGVAGRFDGVPRPILSDDEPLACLPDALCGDVPELDVLGSGPDERRTADVFGLW